MTQMGAIALAFDCEDRLYAVIADYGRDTNGQLAPQAVEIVDGAIKPITDSVAQIRMRFPRNPAPSDNAGQLHLLCASGQVAMFDLQGLPVAEKNAAALMPVATSGTYLSLPLDSQRRGCVWHRVVLTGNLPEKTRIDIQTTTSDVALNANELADLPAQAWSEPVSIRSMHQRRRGRPGDEPARTIPMAQTRLRGRRQVDAAPLVRIVIEFPRVSLRRYLPGVFGMDPVSAPISPTASRRSSTPRCAASSRRIDTFYELFDSATAPAPPPQRGPRGKPATDFLAWLANWIGVTLGAQWPEGSAACHCSSAPPRLLYTIRGTLAMACGGCCSCSWDSDPASCDGACERTRCKPRPLNCAPPPAPCPPTWPPLILEHFKLRRWLFVGAGKLGDDADAVGPAHRQP